jgi:hypothetical protein
LDRFNTDLLTGQYGHVMLIDGNDTRGIDVGILTSPQVEILSMRSSVDLPDPGAAGEHLFSRDCAQYQCRLPSGATVWVLVNHFKSQSGGGGPKRARQAQGVRTIVEDLVAAGERHIVVMGDLNKGPAVLGQPAANLGTLMDPNGPLVEVYALPAFDPGPQPGTFQSCGIRNRLDYILVSQDLAGLVVGGGIERCGLWGRRPTSTRRPSGTSTRRSPAPTRQPPTTRPSTSTSTSDRSCATGRRRVPTRPRVHGVGLLFVDGRTQGVSERIGDDLHTADAIRALDSCSTIGSQRSLLSQNRWRSQGLAATCLGRLQRGAERPRRRPHQRGNRQGLRAWPGVTDRLAAGPPDPRLRTLGALGSTSAGQLTTDVSGSHQPHRFYGQPAS